MWRHLPNLLSIGRMVAVGPLAWWLLHENYLPALMLFVLAALSDLADGYLARRYGWQSELGGILDPLADKLLLLACGLLLFANGLLPGWMLALMLLRDALIVGGALVYHYRFERFQARPSRLSKFATMLQALLLVALMLHGEGLLQAQLLTVLLVMTAAALLASGAGYVIGYTRRAIELRRQGP